MFKFITHMRADGHPCNPLHCSTIRSYLRDNVLVMTLNMFQLIREYKFNELSLKKIIVVGETGCEENEFTLYDHIVFTKTITQAIKYLSEHYDTIQWYFIGDNNTANQMIKQGIIMDVYISKNKYMFNDAIKTYDNVQTMTPFNTSILDNKEYEFSYVSTTKINAIEAKSVFHYTRSNAEELAILTAMRQILDKGFERPNRTGVSTRCLFGQNFQYRLQERIDPTTGKSSYRLPLLTTKKMFVRGVFEELKFFLSGSTDAKVLEEKKVSIWQGNTSRGYLDSVGLNNYNEGETGPIYGFQWKHFGAQYVQGKHDYTGEGVDQVQNVIDSLTNDPFGRRHIISGWAPTQLQEMCLPPCHILYIFLSHEENGQKYLSLMMTQRSCDAFLGLPFNITSCSLFLLMMSQRVNMKPHTLYHSVADMHIYENHYSAVAKQCNRAPAMFPYVSINCDPKEKLEDYDFTDITIEDYHSHNSIKADMVA